MTTDNFVGKLNEHISVIFNEREKKNILSYRHMNYKFCMHHRNFRNGYKLMNRKSYWILETQSLYLFWMNINFCKW